MPDEDGYPLEEELQELREWNPADLHGCMVRVRELWWMPDWGFQRQEDGRVYYLSTGGWSGNESIIVALRDNRMWWVLNWEASRRGGHFTFSKSQVSGVLDRADL